MTTNRLIAPGLGIAAAGFVADQLLKTWAHASVDTQGVIEAFPGLNIIATSNTGVAFSVAQDVPPWLLVSVSVAISLFLLVLLGRTRRAAHALGLGLAIGGALSNVVDRLRLGAVRDFIDLYWRDWHWPAFNLADAAIVSGLAMVLLFSEESRRDEHRSGEEDPKLENIDR